MTALGDAVGLPAGRGVPRTASDPLPIRACPAGGPRRPTRCQTYDTYDTKPKRRLFGLLISQGMQANQAVTFRTDGGDDVRDLPLYLNPALARLGVA